MSIGVDCSEILKKAAFARATFWRTSFKAIDEDSSPLDKPNLDPYNLLPPLVDVVDSVGDRAADVVRVIEQMLTAEDPLVTLVVIDVSVRAVRCS